jgi:hypothetical protein
LPEFSGFAFSHAIANKQHVFEVLGGTRALNIKTYKDFVSVLIEGPEQALW